MYARLLSSRLQTLKADVFSSSFLYRHHRLSSCSFSIITSAHFDVPSSHPFPSSSRTLARRRYSAFTDQECGEGVLTRRKAIKTKVIYVCENCGDSFSQWWGKCDGCKATGTLKKFMERIADDRTAGGGAGMRAAEIVDKGIRPNDTELLAKQGANAENSKLPLRSWLEHKRVVGPQRLTDVLRGSIRTQWRLPLLGDIGIEVGRVLGGGLVPGSLVLIGGDPGVGKSTLLLQICQMVASGCDFYEPAPVLYVSGEESEEQISMRADRLEITTDELFIYAATDLEVILNALYKLHPRAVVIDSIQTIYLPEAPGSAGSIVQVRECAAALLRSSKRTQIPIFLIGHVTRSGDIAGPRVLEHIVDVVLYLEGENQFSHRILRAVKNRFGSTDEVGMFEMCGNGLQVVDNPSQLFLRQRTDLNIPASGAIAMTLEGSRPLFVEIQALCSGAGSQSGRQMVNGVESQRLHLILAVLSKFGGVKTSNQNVLISVVGGLQVREPAVDLSIAVAIACSYYNKQIPADMAFVGEIGLGGELRSVRQLDKRLIEASKLGFHNCVIPKMSEKSAQVCQLENVTLIPCTSIQEVIQNLVLGTFKPIAGLEECLNI